MPDLVTRISRFATVGVAATLVHILVALMLHAGAGMDALEANLAAFVVAWSVSYLGNYVYTFQAVSRHRQSVPRFVAVSLAGFTLNQSIVFFCISHLGLAYWQALIPVAVLVPLFSFVLSLNWAFKPAGATRT
jgi:putative flippase GtrA